MEKDGEVKKKSRGHKPDLNVNKAYFIYNSLGMYLHFQSSTIPSLSTLWTVCWESVGVERFGAPFQSLCFNPDR